MSSHITDHCEGMSHLRYPTLCGLVQGLLQWPSGVGEEWQRSCQECHARVRTLTQNTSLSIIVHTHTRQALEEGDKEIAAYHMKILANENDHYQERLATLRQRYVYTSML